MDDNPDVPRSSAATMAHAFEDCDFVKTAVPQQGLEACNEAV